MINPYLKPFVVALEKHRNPGYAQKMSAYMKDLFPFYGIRSPQRKEICKTVLSKVGLPDLNDLPLIVESGCTIEEREFQYFILDLVLRFKNKLKAGHLDMLEWMITNKSWWDTADLIASTGVGKLVSRYPVLTGRIDAYIDHEDMWLQRTAILYQLKYKEKTDADKLFAFCTNLREDKRFFIRKAIGWALREYSKTNAEAVKKFVNSSEISSFSKKEALKWLSRT